MKERFLKTLNQQLPILVNKKIISRTDADNIKEYYGKQIPGSSKGTILTIIGSLAALLIGSGIILLFAYNWNSISKNLKTVIAFIPLISGQVLVYFSWKKKKSTAWMEASSLFLSLAVGSTIALISQIYHIPGNLDNFLLTWMLLVLPLTYLTGSTGSLVIYLTGILFWSAYSQETGGNAVFYWLLLGAVIPKMVLLIKKELNSNKTTIVSWLVVINLLIGTAISLEKVLPGIWILVYSILLTFCFLIGQIYYKDSFGGFHDPFRTIGSAGIVILSYIFTFEFFWDEIGLNNVRSELRFNKTIAVVDYILLILLLLAVVALIIRYRDKLEFKKITPFILIFILALVAFVIGSFDNFILPQIIIFNSYTVLLGIWIIYIGITNRHLFQINLGMLTVILIIVTRFFDIDIGYTLKGIIFISLGIIFLIANKYLSRKLPNMEDES